MHDESYEKAQWRATIVSLVVLGVFLGAEQIAPLSDALKSQIGVLTVFLMFGFWHLLCGLFESHSEPRDKKG